MDTSLLIRLLTLLLFFLKKALDVAAKIVIFVVLRLLQQEVLVFTFHLIIRGIAQKKDWKDCRIHSKLGYER